MSTRLILLIIASCTIHVVTSLRVEEKHLGTTLQSLERLLNFFENDAKDLNLDGLYGLRIAQGQLLALQDDLRHRTTDRLFTDDRHLIDSFIQQIDRIGNQSLIEINRTDSSYLHRFVLLASRPFFAEFEQRRINHELVETGEKIGEFDEEESDQCFGELLGSNEATGTHPCSVSKSCWTLMTNRLMKDYRITHQLLWFLGAKSIGCLDHRSNSIPANRNLRQLEDRFCANIYQDAILNYKTNYNQDLLLEQILLCSIIGFDEFLQIDWLKTIFTWQDQLIGCFADGNESIENDLRRKRHLLVEQDMANGCLSHKSGLAAGVLASYLQAFLRE